MRALDAELKQARYRDDPAMRALAAADRRMLGEIWRHRAESELVAGSAFAEVVVELYAIGAHAEVLALATQAAHEEVGHARNCHALAELYLDRALSMPLARRAPMPPHRGAASPLRTTLHVMGMSCINETIACEFVSRCLDASEALAVRDASQRHLRDEIGHARVGWAHLASGVLDAQDRAQLTDWVARLVAANGAHWIARMRTLPENGVIAHGYPPVAELIAGVHRALRDVVLPGFSHMGIDVSAAARAAEHLRA